MARFWASVRVKGRVFRRALVFFASNLSGAARSFLVAALERAEAKMRPRSSS